MFSEDISPSGLGWGQLRSSCNGYSRLCYCGTFLFHGPNLGRFWVSEGSGGCATAPDVPKRCVGFLRAPCNTPRPLQRLGGHPETRKPSEFAGFPWIWQVQLTIGFTWEIIEISEMLSWGKPYSSGLWARTKELTCGIESTRRI